MNTMPAHRLRTTLCAALLAAGSAALAADGPHRPLSEGDVKNGKALYTRECSGCHGDRGAGDGPAADFLQPRPRDFTKGLFKLRSTESGTPPTTADVMRTIQRGIPGSAMPPFGFLTEQERTWLAAYALDKGDLLDSPEPEPIPAPPPAPPVTPESIARGKEVYTAQGCFNCHGATGKGDGPSAKTLVDDDGKPIPARDLTGGLFRGGGERADLYTRIMTGMDGTPMPGYLGSVPPEDRWPLVDFVMSLKSTAKAAPLPKDPVLAGREVVKKYGCRGCHVLDDGKGGDVGPDLRISGQKLDPAWVRTFLSDPRAPGKIYPWRPHRMPGIQIAPEDRPVLAAYIQAMGKRKSIAPPPDVSAFPAARVEEGKNLYVLRCAQCHQLGKVVETPAATQQGPDLVNVSGRVDYGWSQQWVLDPKKIDPNSKMTVQGLTPEQVESVRMFVWKTSAEQRAAAGPGAGSK